MVTCRPRGASLLQEVQEVGLAGSVGSMVLLGRLSGLTHALQLSHVQRLCTHDRLLLLLWLPHARSPAQLLGLPGKATLGIEVQACQAIHGRIHDWVATCTLPFRQCCTAAEAANSHELQLPPWHQACQGSSRSLCSLSV